VAPIDSARRELLEETALVAASWLEVLRNGPVETSISDERAICFSPGI